MSKRDTYSASLHFDWLEYFKKRIFFFPLFLSFYSRQETLNLIDKFVECELYAQWTLVLSLKQFEQVSCFRWRRKKFSSDTHTLSLSHTHTRIHMHMHLTFGSCYQYSLTAWLLDKNISYQSVLIFVFLVLVDFNSNTNNKTTPFNHHLFSTDSFLNYSKKSDRRTSSPIKTHHQEEEEDDDIEEEEEENHNENSATDDELDEDSCNR